MKAKIYLLRGGVGYEVLTSSGVLYVVRPVGSAWSWSRFGVWSAGWTPAAGARLLRSIPPILKKDFFTYNKKP